MRLGLISDTHGRLDSRVPIAFAVVDRILHAGDICAPEVLWELDLLGKPVQAVLGNCDDPGALGIDLPSIARFELGGVRFLLVHDRHDAGHVSAEDTDVVVFGHSHMPLVEEREGVLWVNPGSASQARRSPVGRSVAYLDVTGGAVSYVEIVPLDRFGEQQPTKR